MVPQSTVKIDVSIIIINYFSTNLIDDCLNSFLKFAEGFTFEIIIVDNSNEENKLKSLIKKYHYLQIIINKENKGFGAANNQGLNISKGRYVLFLNNDIIFLENTIKNILNYLSNKKAKVIVGCKLLNSDLSLQYSILDFPTLLNHFTSNFFFHRIFPKSKYFNKYHLMNKKINKTTEVEVVTGAFMFCSADLIKDLGGFDKRFFFYGEEIDLCKRFKNNGGSIIYFPETSVIHLKGATASKNLWFHFKNRNIAMIQYMQKHFNRSEYIFGILIHYLGLGIRIPILFLQGFLTFQIKYFQQSFYYLRLLFTYPRNKFVK